MTRSRETHRITWRGIVLEIRYEAQWLGHDGPFATAHLEIESIEPANLISCLRAARADLLRGVAK